MTTPYHFARALILCAFGSVTAGSAFAQSSWDLDACVMNGSCSSGGSTITSITGWYSNGASSAFAQGTLNTGGTAPGGWTGVKSKNSGGTWETTSSNNHAIDNLDSYSNWGATYAELVYLNFDQAVDLNKIAATWTHGGSGMGDFELWRWNDGTSGPGNLSNYNANSLSSSGWTQAAAGDFGSGGYEKTFNDGTYYSSHWLITTKFGGSNDAFKLGKVTGSACPGGTGANGSGACVPDQTPGLPEPASLALFAVAALGAGAARRRALSKKA